MVCLSGTCRPVLCSNAVQQAPLPGRDADDDVLEGFRRLDAGDDGGVLRQAGEFGGFGGSSCAKIMRCTTPRRRKRPKRSFLRGDAERFDALHEPLH